MGDKKYADMKFYENKLNNLMNKLNVDKFYYKWTEKDAYIKFKYKYKWYLINHTIENANINRTNNDKIVYGSDLFAQLVLVIENLSIINDYNICNFSDWISSLELVYDNNLPESFKKIGFVNNILPTPKVLNNKISEIKKVIGPNGLFYSKDNYEQLLEIEKECNEYYQKNTKS